MTAIRNWFRKFTGRRATTIRNPHRTAPPLGLEPLDARILLSATAYWNTVAGSLRIDSDGASDQIRVLEVGPLNMTQLALVGISSLSVNGQAPVAASNPAIPTWGVRSLDVRLNGGDDSLTVSLSRWAINVTNGQMNWNGAADNLRTITVDGGAGRDSINVLGTFAATATLTGGTEDDTITGTQLTDIIRGGGGVDVLRGGGGNDTIYGDAGNDTIWGEGGNDNLYGGDGADTLYGGSGNDGLYGGMGKDYLWGGEPDLGYGYHGKDRFLILANEPNPGGAAITDTILYFDVWNDARINFTNGPQMTTSFAGQLGSYTYSAGAFTAAEIEQTDGAFAALVNRTQNTRLLKKSDGSELRFEKQGMVTAATGTFSAGAWNDGTKIHLLNLSFTAADPTVVQGFLMHEIGHNWDSTAENASFGQFQALSGWTNTPPAATSISYWRASDTGTNWWYRRSAQMVSTYAQTNPQEDFAESFRSYFGFGNAAAAPAKMAYLDGFFNGKSG